MRTWVKVALGAGGLAALALWAKSRGLGVGLCTVRGYIGDAAQAEPGNVEAIRGAGLSLNLQVLGRVAPSVDEPEERSALYAPICEAWRRLGVPVVVWGYHIFRDVETAKREGELAALGTVRTGSDAYYANIEEPFWYLAPGASARANVEAFGRAFRDSCGASLRYNGLAGADRLTPAGWALFDTLAPMIYGVKGSGNTAKVRRELTSQWANRAGDAAARGQAFEPYLWTGDLDAHGGHRDYQADLDGEPGQVSRVALFQPRAVWFWYWADQAKRRSLTETTPDGVNLSVAAIAPMMREARRAGSSWPGYPSGGVA